MGNENIVFVDVREPDEYASGHAPEAVNIPLSKMVAGPASIDALPKDKKLVVYCNSGNRSGAAIDLLGKAGYNNLENGINASEVEKKYL